MVVCVAPSFLIPKFHSFICLPFMPDEKEEKMKFVVVSESSLHVDGSGATQDVGMHIIDHFPPDISIVQDAVVGEEARRRGGE